MNTIQKIFEGNIYGIEKIQIAIYFIAVLIIYILYSNNKKIKQDNYTETNNTSLPTFLNHAMTPTSMSKIPTTMDNNMVPTIIGTGILPITMNSATTL